MTDTCLKLIVFWIEFGDLRVGERIGAYIRGYVTHSSRYLFSTVFNYLNFVVFFIYKNPENLFPTSIHDLGPRRAVPPYQEANAPNAVSKPTSSSKFKINGTCPITRCFFTFLTPLKYHSIRTDCAIKRRVSCLHAASATTTTTTTSTTTGFTDSIARHTLVGSELRTSTVVPVPPHVPHSGKFAVKLVHRTLLGGKRRFAPCTLI